MMAGFLSVQLPSNFPLTLPLMKVSPQFLQYVWRKLETMPTYCTVTNALNSYMLALLGHPLQQFLSFLLPCLKQEGKRTRIPHLLVLFPSPPWNLSVLPVTPLASFKSFEKTLLNPPCFLQLPSPASRGACSQWQASGSAATRAWA